MEVLLSRYAEVTKIMITSINITMRTMLTKNECIVYCTKCKEHLRVFNLDDLEVPTEENRLKNNQYRNERAYQIRELIAGRITKVHKCFLPEGNSE